MLTGRRRCEADLSLIAALETRLGIQLRLRSTRGRRFTEEGQRYLQASGQIIDAVERADQPASIARAAVTGELRVSTPTEFGTSQILPLVPGFLDNNPGVRLNLQLSNDPLNLIEDNIDYCDPVWPTEGFGT